GPQERAAVPGAPVQGHDQRPGPLGAVVFRHVEREAAARAGLVVEMADARLIARRRLGEAGQPRRVVAMLRLQEVAADRRQARRERVERLLGPWDAAQRPIDLADVRAADLRLPERL